MWGTILKVRQISAVTKEQVDDVRLTEIINESDRKVRGKVFYVFDGIVVVGNRTEKKIQMLGMNVGDGNFNSVVDKEDIEIFRVYNDVGFTKKEILPVTSFDAENSIVEFTSDIPADTFSFWVKCFQNAHNFSYAVLSDASSYFAAAAALRITSSASDKKQKADDYENLGARLIRRVSAGYI
ncbi:TPA_asm: hypothetical protein [Altiarchaeum virus]|nr:TPA_asm: hypothetical protein [Altiarchaeum virus]